MSTAATTTTIETINVDEAGCCCSGAAKGLVVAVITGFSLAVAVPCLVVVCWVYFWIV